MANLNVNESKVYFIVSGLYNRLVDHYNDLDSKIKETSRSLKKLTLPEKKSVLDKGLQHLREVENRELSEDEEEYTTLVINSFYEYILTHYKTHSRVIPKPYSIPISEETIKSLIAPKDSTMQYVNDFIIARRPRRKCKAVYAKGHNAGLSCTQEALPESIYCFKHKDYVPDLKLE